MTTEDTTMLQLARIREVDHKDEEQILATLQGELVEEYVYSFKDGRGRTQEGLSWAGTRELAEARGNIVLDEPVVEEKEDHFRVMVRANDLDRNISVWGGTHQPKMMRVANRDTGEYRMIPDDYCFEKAISKAQRNAIKNLLPVAFVKEVIARLKHQGGNRETPPPQRRPQRPKPPVDETIPPKTEPTPPKGEGALTRDSVPKDRGEFFTWSLNEHTLNKTETLKAMSEKAQRPITDKDVEANLGPMWMFLWDTQKQSQEHSAEEEGVV